MLVCIAEDLGTGYCHSHGLGWVGDSVLPDQIIGDVMEASNESSTTTNTIIIYWPLLVLRPACVDTLIITTQGISEVFIYFSARNSTSPV